MLIAALLALMCRAEAAGAPLPPAARARVLTSGVVGSSVVTALDRDETVRVMIAFSRPRGGRARDAAGVRAEIDAIGRDIVRRFAPGEFRRRWRYRAIEAIAGEIDAAGLVRLLDDPRVRRVDVDVGGSAQLAEAVPLSQLSALHALGYTGAGVTVAVIDSGVDTDHPDLGDDLAAERCFCSTGVPGCCPDGSSDSSGPGSAEDDNGHGTNVAGIVTSRGSIAPPGGAPDAEIVAVKVLDQNGNFCCSSDIVAALDWILTERPDVDVVNLSLGTFQLFPGACDAATAYTQAFAAAIDALRATGVLTFASAGNSGSGAEMSAPACVAGAIAVGAVYDADVGSVSKLGCTDPTTQADQLTCFSNSNATTDLFAPGAPITSTGLAGGTSTYYGTSQASPLAAACAALLLDYNPTLSPGAVELALESSSTLVTDATNGLSFPRLDCAQASAAAPAACAATPVAGCLTPGKSALLLKDVSLSGTDPDRGDKLVWKWTRGPSVQTSEIGDPLEGLTGYSLCVYDASGGTPHLVMSAGVPARGTCGNGKPCWRRLGRATNPKGYKYVDKARDRDGVLKVLLKSGPAGASKVVVVGKGATLPLPGPAGGTYLDQNSAVTVQLIKNDGGVCWQGSYSSPAARNRGDLFRDTCGSGSQGPCP